MAVPEPAPTPAPMAAPLPPPAIAPMAAPMAAPPPMVAALRLPREVPTCSYSLLASTYDLPWNCMRTNSSRNSLRPLMRPAERASTSFTYTSVPVGTTISLSTTSGASSEARKISPVWLVSESMASIMRTTTEVPAGNSTCLGCGGGGGAGGGAGAAATGSAAGVGGGATSRSGAAEVFRDSFRAGAGAGRGSGLASGNGADGASAILTLMRSLTLVTPGVSVEIGRAHV